MSDETLPPEVAAGTAAGSATAPVEGEERAHRPPPRFLHGLIEANIAVVTVCAAFAGLFFGAILICVTTPTVNQAFGHLFSNPGHAFGTAWSTVAGAYSPMIEGSLIDPHALAHAISSGTGWNTAFTPISETLVSATPLMLAGLGVGLGFSTGVFNIGAQGQYIGGALAALYVGFQFHLPIGIHLPLVIIAGAVGGGIVGFVPGFLKAQTGA
ncbi:MAG TPA: hypothetical protein VGS21_12725, partial [Acidimicrobiales bacterium]|nr:hypothetical protein [Acidimicrobiales bacterium]